MVATVGALNAKNPQTAKNAAASQPIQGLSEVLIAPIAPAAAIKNATSDQRTLTAVL